MYYQRAFAVLRWVIVSTIPDKFEMCHDPWKPGEGESVWGLRINEQTNTKKPPSLSLIMQGTKTRHAYERPWAGLPYVCIPQFWNIGWSTTVDCLQLPPRAKCALLVTHGINSPSTSWMKGSDWVPWIHQIPEPPLANIESLNVDDEHECDCTSRVCLVV